MGVVGRKRKGGTTWYAVFTANGRQVHERVGSDKRQAERILRQRSKEVAAGVYSASAPTGAITLGAWLDRWLDARTCRSADVYRWRATHLLSRPWLTRKRLDDLNPGDMARLVTELSASVGAGSVRAIWGALRTCLRDAVIAGAISSSPCLLPRGAIPEAPRTNREPYEPSEVAALLRDPRVPPHMRIVFAVVLYTGVRRGEACGLRWGDLAPAKPLRALTCSRQWADAPLKTAKRVGEKSRVIPVHPELERHLAEWSPVWEQIACRRPRPEDPILINPDGRGLLWSASALEHRVDEACRVVGAPCRGLHSARHTCITWLRRCGARMDVVERMTHNASGSVVDRYTHWDWEPLCNAMLALHYDAGYDAKAKSPEKDVPTATYEVARRAGIVGNQRQSRGNVFHGTPRIRRCFLSGASGMMRVILADPSDGNGSRNPGTSAG